MSSVNNNELADIVNLIPRLANVGLGDQLTALGLLTCEQLQVLSLLLLGLVETVAYESAVGDLAEYLGLLHGLVAEAESQFGVEVAVGG